MYGAHFHLENVTKAIRKGGIDSFLIIEAYADKGDKASFLGYVKQISLK